MVINVVDGGLVDMNQKAAKYIEKNCSINQEFNFAHPLSRIALNKIYNCHFSGCQIWNLFSQGAEKFYGTYNRSVKVMADLPYATHRYLIEPVSGQQHMSTTVIRNFLNFISRVRQSPKPVLRQLYGIAKVDVRPTTGCNLRNILLLTNLTSVDDLLPSIVEQISYKEISPMDKWRVPLIKEVIDMKYGDVSPPDGWTLEELEEILDFACTQ